MSSLMASITASEGTALSLSGSISASPCATYRSVGKLLCCVRIVRRSGRARTAALSSLNRHTLVESAISNSLGLAPTIGASLAAIRVGQSIQPCLFQLAMRSSPHCFSAVRHNASGAPAGNGPSELPSR
jgi:hypothetical protein